MKWFERCALISVCILCFAVSYTVVTIGHSANATLARVNATLDKVNGKYGLLNETAATIVRTKDLITLSQLTLYKQQKSIDLFNRDLHHTLSHLNVAIAATVANENLIATQTTTTLQATTDSIKALQPLVNSLTTESQDLQTATVSVTNLVQDPHLLSTISHVDSTATHIDHTSADVEHEVHAYVYPGPWQKVWNFISGIGLDVGKLFLP